MASRVGEGSFFSFYLPALASESEKNKKGEFREKIVNGKETVLLVDDEQSVIDVCSEMLVSLGYEVISVQKGKDALDILKQDDINIDLVILDMIMPEMSGLKVFKQIKSISPEMKVLLASGYSQKNDVEKLIRQSSDGFIQKPFDVARLSKRVMSCLESDIPPMS
ncbi:MAG: response regulator [Thermodesulfobacteriota bacterium]|nr:response regulator [Thermodesulfobacteriota bacterium]